MEILIVGGKAIDQRENGYEITGILIERPNSKGTFYDNTTTFFKAACPDGTKHKAFIESPGIVSLR